MIIEIYQEGEKINISELSVTDYKKELNDAKENFALVQHNFSSIHYLNGNKTLLEDAFQHQKKESLNY